MTNPAAPGRVRSRAAGRALTALAAALCLGVAGCATTVDGTPHAASAPTTATSTPRSTAPGTPSAPGTPQPSPSDPGPGAKVCPASYVAPLPKRPTVDLRFEFAADLTTVTGHEHVEFVPDRPITELVFRLTANSPATVAEGNKIEVTAARASGGTGTYTFSRAAAPASTQGGLLRIPLAKQVPAGTKVSADIDFTVTLGGDSFDRFGRTDHDGKRYAWIGSAQPLLAWQVGYGWHTEDLALFPAESATSEAARTRLTVLAPEGDVVLMSGNPTEGTPDGKGRKSWTGELDAARDVSVAVGPFVVSDFAVGPTKVRVGAYAEGVRDALAPEFQRAITALEAYFGPFPYPSLSVARVPAAGGGIEYPGSILMLDGSRLVAVHETAHQWFYGMVGDSQAQDPWLDEAFAQYAEQLVNGTPEPPATLSVPGEVGASVGSYGNNMSRYYFITYNKGAAALEAARKAAGAALWDAALRCYVNANAWRIAVPANLAAALADLPAALAVLRKAGALP